MHPCGGGGSQLRNSNVLPSHPFIQDPTMPPNPAPSPLIQLEEVRRRLEEEKIQSGTMQPKQRSEVTLIISLSFHHESLWLAQAFHHLSLALAAFP